MYYYIYYENKDHNTQHMSKALLILSLTTFVNRWEQQSRRRWKRGRFLRSICRRLKRRVRPWIAIPAHPSRAQLAAQVFSAAVTIQWLHTHAIMSSDVYNELFVRHRFVTCSILGGGGGGGGFAEVYTSAESGPRSLPSRARLLRLAALRRCHNAVTILSDELFVRHRFGSFLC